jgi:hypothetical protein
VDITVLGEGQEKKVFANIDIKDKEHAMSFDLDFKPTKVVLDEENWTLHSPGSSNMFPRDDKNSIKITAVTAETKPAVLPATLPATVPATSTKPAAQTAPARK